ncbi:MAG: hypothetical protein K0R50_3649 [Eubacterium sp.]|jgi:hypothetical protein|nr:hypothetical protein [Eubacterium sp.]
MKLFRNAIILVVVLGLLVGAYFFLSNRKTGDTGTAEETTAAETIKVMSVDQEKISFIEFNNENGTFKLNKKDKAWTIEPEMEFPVDNSLADSSATDFAEIIADKVVEENATDLSKYGLDKPASAKVGLTDGTTKEVEIGSSNPTNEGIYVKLKGENKVYLIGSYYENKLKLNKGHFAVKDILNVEAAAVKAISYEKNDELQFAISINSETDAKITAPIKEEADTAEVSKMTAAVVQLAISDVIDDNPDLAKYGLDKPAFAIEYGDGKTTKKILFGKELEKDKIAYAKFPEGKSVFTVDISPLTFLDTKFSNLVNSFVYLPNINDVNKIELTIDGKTVVSDITTVKDDSDKDTFKVDGKDANMKDKDDKSLFRTFYQALIGITMNKYEPAPKPSGTPEVTIKYYMKPDNKPVTIEYISKDENYYYAMKDGVYTNRVVLKSKLNEADGIRPTYKALKEAVDKAGK